jgi:hypothetical protein
MPIGREFNTEDSARMSRLQEEIFSRMYEVTLIIDRNIGREWPLASDEMSEQDPVVSRRGPTVVVGDATFTVLDDHRVMYTKGTDCVIYDEQSKTCYPCG